MTTLCLAVLVIASSAPSFEFESPQEQKPPTAEEERSGARERYVERLHSEITFGYIGEWRSDTQQLWESKGDPAGSAMLTAPFTTAPFGGYRAAGPAIESRTVWDGVRFTLGFRWPFASFRQADTKSTADFGGASHELLVRSLSLWEFRTAVGYELPFRWVTPFVDLLGDVQRLTAGVVVDGTSSEWNATGFSLGARAGVRLQISQVFLMVSGEATVLGAPRYGGSFYAGFAL